MKKKRLFLLLLMLICSVFTLTSCATKKITYKEQWSTNETGHWHDSNEGKKTNGFEEHTFSEATCTTPKTYTVCGYTVGEALGHGLVHHDGKDATCLEKGFKAYDTCSRCDYSTYEEIPALGHDIVHHEAKDPTCTEIGWKAYDACSRCDYSTYEEIPALGHDMSDATCSEESKCSRCDHTEGEKLAHELVNGVCTLCGKDFSNEVTYELSEDKTYFIITGTSTTDSFLDIPCSIDGLPVKEIKEEVFADNLDIEKVFIPASITAILRDAFYGCSNLKEINFEEGTTLKSIGDYAFYATAITKFVLSNTVTSLGSDVFSHCSELKDFTFEKGI